jgi:Flp pilus assembly protein TadG
MYNLRKKLKELFKGWIFGEEAIAATEAAMVFPILLTLLLGTFDMGNGILANQKAIRASQVTADLITRGRAVTDHDIDEAVEAGKLAFSPLDSSSFGVDIVSIGFDDDADPEIVWRETRNMQPLADVLDRVEDLAESNNGVVVVTIRYLFKPVFAGFIVDHMPMQEIAFSRGRKSAVVTKDD